jgi:hypothetical protein
MSANTTKSTILFSGLIVLYSGLAGYEAYSFFSKPNLENVKIIQPQAKVIDNYDGNAPLEQLDRLIGRIEIVRADNPTYSSDITKLEETINGAKVAIGDTTDPSIYSPIMDKVAKSANDFADSHSRSALTLVVAAMWLGNTGYAVRSMNKMRRTAREREELEAHNARRRVEAEAYAARELEDMAAAARAVRRTRRRAAEPRIDPNTETRPDDNDIWKNRDDQENDGNQL